MSENKPTVGVVTILKVNNYGAELQAYATCRALQLSGFDAEIIDYLFYKNPGHRATRMSRPSLPAGLVQHLKERLFPLVEKLRGSGNSEARRKREERFSLFHNRNTPMSATFSTLDSLMATPPQYDVYLTGSDQVWNPGIYSSLEPYMLTFAPEGKPRVSYAASFGVGELPAGAVDFYRERLRRYKAIGVREQTGVGIVKDASGMEATWVLDPTLLLDRKEWMKVALPVEDLGADRFVLVYELTPCPDIIRLAHKIAAARGLSVVRICRDAAAVETDGSVINITDAGPAEFLWLLDKAEAIVTNSFHGTAFSVNFNKEFYCITPARKRNNSRQQSLLGLFGLSERIIPEGFGKVSFSMPDYSRVNRILSQERDKSFAFLKKAVNDGK